MLLLFILLIAFPLLIIANEQDTSAQRALPKTIIDDAQCKEIQTICNNLSENDDMLILECLFATNPERIKMINKSCQQVIWDHSWSLIKDSNVKSILTPICGTELQNLPCKEMADDKENGQYLKCIISNINDIQDSACNQMLLRFESVAFTDYRWIKNFINHCTEDIKNLNCGRFDTDNHSQTKTLICLQDGIMNVKSDECKKEIFKLSELQSENIKFDNQLFIDCAGDYSRYCHRSSPGSGRVITCLMQQFLMDPSKIEKRCKHQLVRRQKLIAADFRVSKGLLKTCKDDIKRGHCRKQNSSDKTVRLAQILLCLENLMKNGTKLDSDCTNEMIDHRRMLMEDFHLSPEIVNSCKNETQMYCKGYEIGGKTIHCLMNQALVHSNSVVSRLSDVCLRSLEDLVRKADVGENWSVDPVLHEACDPVRKVACRNIQDGNARVMSCLMDNLRSDAMTENCENALIEIQYFVSRDFKLDPQLYKVCKQDAAQHCHYFDPTGSEVGPSYSSQVLPCLYRHAYQQRDEWQTSEACAKEIQRVMRQRALSVDLQPEIEEVCVRDLASYCFNKVKKGEEMQCLQENLEDLDDKCHDAVESFTELEAQHVELNPFISKYCNKVIETLCDSDNSQENEDVMDCLIENKNHVLVKSTPSCRASIEHFQLISLKSYKFTYKFKLSCKPYIMRFCTSRAHSLSEVISCLSEHILNATIQRVKSNISKECRQQLKSQLFQQREKIDYDPMLKRVCSDDIKKFCASVPSGNAQILECLQTQKALSESCAKQIFKVQKFEAYDNTVDYALQTMCAETIDQFCPRHGKETIFECLKINKDEKGFGKKCRTIVMHRLIEQNTNNLLNPALQKNCQHDIAKFCKKELLNSDEKTIGDSVMKCLKLQFRHDQLTKECHDEVEDILKDRALDVNLNPAIRAACKLELETVCNFDTDEFGKVEECLKFSFINKNIPTMDCKKEVANMIQESKADIHIDPILQRACAVDLLSFCSNVEQGNGRHIQCLKQVMERTTQSLSPSCKAKLTERLEMYKNAAKVGVDDLSDLYEQVYSSPAKNYIVIMLFVIIGGIFFFGVFCGRTFRRNYRLLKNK